MADLMRLLVVMFVVQALWSVGISVLVGQMPDDVRVGRAFELSGDISEVTDDLEESLGRQTNIPVLDMGALVFYSGNILMDLLMNFLGAIPEMITLLITGVMLLFNVPVFVQNSIQLFVTVVIGAVYLISLMQMIMSFRSVGRVVG